MSLNWSFLDPKWFWSTMLLYTPLQWISLSVATKEVELDAKIIMDKMMKPIVSLLLQDNWCQMKEIAYDISMWGWRLSFLKGPTWVIPWSVTRVVIESCWVVFLMMGQPRNWGHHYPMAKTTIHVILKDIKTFTPSLWQQWAFKVKPSSIHT